MTHALATDIPTTADDGLTPEQRQAHRLPAWTRVDVCTCKHCSRMRAQATDLARRTMDPEYHDNGNALRDAFDLWLQRVLDSLVVGGLLGVAALFLWVCWDAIRSGAVARLLAR